MNKQKKERTEQKIQYGKYSRMPLAQNRKGQGKVSETNKKTTVMYGHRLKKGIFLV